MEQKNASQKCPKEFEGKKNKKKIFGKIKV